MNRLNIKLIFRRIFLIFGLFFLFLFTNLLDVKGTTIDLKQLLYQTSSATEAYSIAEEYNLEVIKMGYSGIVTYEVRNESIIPELLDKGFSYNNINESTALPNLRKDPRLKEQYALTMMQTIEAWNITSGSNDVVVAVIDTGIDIYHPEFEGRISPLSYNSYDKTVGINAVRDDQGHGTMVAGVIGANKDNGIGIAGIAQNVTLLVIKANIPNQEKGQFYDDSIIDGIYYAADHGANVINLSLGGPGYNSLMRKAVDYAYNKGIAVVAAAGNDSTSEKFYPAAYDLTISVSAVNENQQLADYSNYGSTITVAAPGSRIVTTDRNNTYSEANGTSLAAPQVSGVLALMYSHFKDIPIEEIIARLTLTAVDLGAVGKDIQYGYGLINTYNALNDDIYSVSFETFEGSKIDPIYIKKGNTFPLPLEPTLKDHFFDGWFLDESFTIPLQLEDLIVNDNITLYAKFTKLHYQVTFITNGSQIPTIIVNYGEIFNPPPSHLEHYDFVNWTIDPERNIDYVPSPIYDDLILYAKFTPKVYTINLFYDDELLETLDIAYLEVVNLPTFEKENHTFIGWFLDSELTIQFNNSTISEDINLYAKFKHNSLQVNYYVDQELVKSIIVEYNEELEQFIPPKIGHTFAGWFLDPDFNCPYDNDKVLTDLNLYARFKKNTYLVRFYSYDESILLEVLVSHGFPVTPPDAPNKPSTLNFQYDFQSWSANISIVTSNLDVYPIYQKNYKEESITLNPGIDTIEVGKPWLDAGLNNIEQDLEVIKLGEVNTEETGRYEIIYNIYSEDTLLDQITRYVRVVSKKPEISITLNPGVSTIVVGKEYIDAGVSCDSTNVEVLNNVDSSKTGVYQVIYKVTIDDYIITKIRYVHVLESSVNQTPLYAPYLKRKEDLLEV